MASELHFDLLYLPTEAQSRFNSDLDSVCMQNGRAEQNYEQGAKQGYQRASKGDSFDYLFAVGRQVALKGYLSLGLRMFDAAVDWDRDVDVGSAMSCRVDHGCR